MRTRFILIVGLVLTFLSGPVRATNVTNHVVISELQTGTTASASQEFIELYNPTDQPLALDGWQLEYRPAGATSSWTNRTSGGLHGQIPADGFYLIAPTTYLSNADAALSSGMAAGGGSVRLVDNGGQVIDLLGWGTAVEFETTAAAAPAAGGSLERLPGASNSTGGNGIDSDNNQADFGLRDQAEPQSSASPIELPGDVLAPPASTGSGGSNNPGSTVGAVTTYPAVKLNELLIDPVSPQSDSKDEFIELFNPNPSPVDLKGYVLKTGANFHDSYTLPEQTIPAAGYLTLYSAQTKLSLTNSGGAAELLDPSGQVIDQSAEYDGSLPGLSFARFGDDWQWTKALTPNAANVFVAPDVAGDSTVTAKTTSPKTKSTSAKKTSSIKASKVKAPKASKTSAAGLLAAQASGLGGKWLIIGLVVLTLGYAIYEFRYDLQNYYIRIQRYYQTRRKARSQTQRRGGHRAS